MTAATVAMKPFRCQNGYCSEDAAGRNIFDFWVEADNDAPACPKCKLKKTVIALEILHYDPPGDVKDYGSGRRACNPDIPIGRGRATAHPETVNCPACRATKVWEDVMAMRRDGVALPGEHHEMAKEIEREPEPVNDFPMMHNDVDAHDAGHDDHNHETA